VNKLEFITSVSQKSELTKKDATSALNAILETITQALVEKDTVSLIGFGTFSTSKRAARNGINPATGAKIQIAESTVVKFKTGLKLKNSVNNR